jgi:hypothetical protein
MQFMPESMTIKKKKKNYITIIRLMTILYLINLH